MDIRNVVLSLGVLSVVGCVGQASSGSAGSLESSLTSGRLDAVAADVLGSPDACARLDEVTDALASLSLDPARVAAIRAALADIAATLACDGAVPPSTRPAMCRVNTDCGADFICVAETCRQVSSTPGSASPVPCTSDADCAGGFCPPLPSTPSGTPSPAMSHCVNAQPVRDCSIFAIAAIQRSALDGLNECLRDCDAARSLLDRLARVAADAGIDTASAEYNRIAALVRQAAASCSIASPTPAPIPGRATCAAEYAQGVSSDDFTNARGCFARVADRCLEARLLSEQLASAAAISLSPAHVAFMSEVRQTLASCR